MKKFNIGVDTLAVIKLVSRPQGSSGKRKISKSAIRLAVLRSRKAVDVVAVGKRLFLAGLQATKVFRNNEIEIELPKRVIRQATEPA